MKALTLAFAFLLAGSTAAVAQTYTLTEIGRPCHADLTGQLAQLPQGQGIRFGLRSRQPNALAVLVIGDRAPSPVALPGGPCQLFVDPRATMLSTTDANGDAAFGFRVPPVLPIRILFQGVVVDVTPSGRRAAATDVIRLTGQ
ncbi:MAG: hypothetical protein KDE27_13650 [Planctomycetes bacterium]|nr:hypothetical protein [Planctomycetota bacterium]